MQIIASALHWKVFTTCCYSLPFLVVTGMFLLTDDSFSFQESLECQVFCVCGSSVISLHLHGVQTKFHVKKIAMEILKHILHKSWWRLSGYYINSSFPFSGCSKDTLYWSSGPRGERYLPKRDCQRKVRSVWSHPCGQPDFPKQGHQRKSQSKMEWSLWGIINKNTLLRGLWSRFQNLLEKIFCNRREIRHWCIYFFYLD